jgi:hypothetical protein
MVQRLSKSEQSWVNYSPGHEGNFLKTRIENLNSAVSIIRDEVESAVLQSMEKPKPWYKNSEVLFAMLSLILSIAAGTGSVLQQNASEHYTKLGDLRNSIDDLYVLEKDIKAQSGENSSAHSLLNHELAADLDRISILDMTTNNSLSSQEYMGLALIQTADNSDPMGGETYYLQAFKNANDDNTRREVCLFTAIFYYTAGVKISESKGNEYYRQALEFATRQPIARGQDRNFFFYLINKSWAENLHDHDRELSYMKLGAAAQAAMEMSPIDQYRSTCFSNLAEMVRSWKQHGDAMTGVQTSVKDALQSIGIQI